MFVYPKNSNKKESEENEHNLDNNTKKFSNIILSNINRNNLNEMNNEEKNRFYKAFENFNISDSDISDSVENGNDEIIVVNNDTNKINNLDKNENNFMDNTKTPILINIMI